MIFEVRKERVWNKSEVMDIVPVIQYNYDIKDIRDACKWFKDQSERYTKRHLDEILDTRFGNYSVTSLRVFDELQVTENKTYDAYCIGTIGYTTDIKEYGKDEIEISYYYKY